MNASNVWRCVVLLRGRGVRSQGRARTIQARRIRAAVCVVAMVGWAWTAASQTGTITTVAGTGTAAYGGDGGPATNAALSTPVGVAVDGGGNLFVADYSNSRVRRVDAATGVITTVAGMGVGGYNGDNIAATTAQLNQPTGMFADGGGNLRIADLLNQRIRREVCLRAAAT